MKLEKNTILITGGSTGIGLELAKRMVEKNNTVIICSRSSEKLNVAKSIIPSVVTYRCDISVKSECEKLADWISSNYPECNILINNAAIVHKTDFFNDNRIVEKSELEIRTNYFAPIMLTKLFLPLLEQNKNPGIVFVTTGLIYAPKAAYPIYCSTKSGLHSFIQTLRLQLKSKNIKISEVIMTVVDTPFHNGHPPKRAVTTETAVQEMVNELAKDKLEIKIGSVKILYLISRIAPSLASKIINES